MDQTETDTDRVEGAQMYLEMIDKAKYNDPIANRIDELIDELDSLALEVELYRKHNLEE